MAEGKKVLMVIAPDKFRDEELFNTREELEKEGAVITVASRSTGVISGMLGGSAVADKALKDINVSEYDAVVFIGGVGAQEYYQDTTALGLAKEAYQEGKIVGAICIAPGILAKAGILAGKRATIWDDPARSYSTILEEGGATYTGEDLTVDGKIVTANGPAAARAFGRKLAELLGGM